MYVVIFKDLAFRYMQNVRVLFVPSDVIDVTKFVQEHYADGTQLEIISEPELAEHDGDVVLGSAFTEDELNYAEATN